MDDNIIQMDADKIQMDDNIVQMDDNIIQMDEEILLMNEEETDNIDIDNISIISQLPTLPPRVPKRGRPKGDGIFHIFLSDYP